MLIENLMSNVISSVKPDEPLSAALELMQTHSQSCVLVCENNTLLGIVTERDIVRAFFSFQQIGSIDDPVVSQVMTAKPICIRETSSLRDALLLACERRLRHLPVVNERNDLLGLLTQTDMMKAYMEQIGREEKLTEENKELEQLTLEDALLGIGNRRAMDLDLSSTQALAKRSQRPFAVALIDVDYFKKYNDCYGHQLGDEALRKVVQAMKTSMRGSDRLYRYGGEEFVMLMPDTVMNGAVIGAERIRSAVEKLEIPHSAGLKGYLTVSAGVAVSSNVGNVVKQADKAMYKAKSSGRNRVFY